MSHMAVLLIEPTDEDLQLWSAERGEATLDDLLSGAWEGLSAAGSSTATVSTSSGFRSWRRPPSSTPALKSSSTRVARGIAK